MTRATNDDTRGGPSHVGVAPATRAERTLIDGLFQFYAYDFSEFVRTDAAGFDFNERGLFDAYPEMDLYWSADNHWPLLIRDGERVAGFALINTHSHLTGGTVERNMAEFFVGRRYRRNGIASDAVRQILKLHPGRWEVAVAERNAAARAFWPKAIAAAPNVGELRVHEGDGKRWRGPIWSFVASTAATPASVRP